MLSLYMADKPLGVWVSPTASAAARARFIRHHLHEFRCSLLDYFGDLNQAEFEDVKIIDLPVGIYELHLGDGILSKLVVSRTMVMLDSVTIITTPDKNFCSVPPDVIQRLSKVLFSSRNIRRVDVYARNDMFPFPAGGTMLPSDGILYLVSKVEHQPDERLGHTYLGYVDLQTGYVMKGRTDKGS